MHRPILLSEQTIYDTDEIRRHINEGDTDENENLLLYHPGCEVGL